MSLSVDLISQFAKLTKEEKKKDSETTVYGETVEYDGRMYVRIDGSELLTPVATTTTMEPGERVTVLLKNHTATVTGNITSPSGRNSDVQAVNSKLSELGSKISEFDIIVAGSVTTEQLNAEKARIDSLVSDNVTIKKSLTAAEADIDTLQAENVTITESLTAAEADIDTLQADNVTIKENLEAANAEIENLKTTKLDAEIADITYATIENLEATNADVNNLEATYASFEVATANKFSAVDASIGNLEAGQAKITNLESDVADINTLIFGSATGDTIHTQFSNSVIAQLGNAQIKSAMIESVSADKITAGDIITNNVRVRSEDGSLIISDETMQISDENRVRVQIGKDAAGDYSINIWDVNGNLMFSKGGITDSAIKEAIIRNDMVSDTANIAAHKLDIDSLFEEINGSANTIKSTKVYLDDEKQTLDVAFTSLSSDVTELQNGVSSQGTAISVMQGQIASKIWQQDITSATSELAETTDNLSTQYSTLEQELDSVSATVASHTSQISTKADSSTVTTVSNKVSSLETNLDSFRTTVSNTYATKTALASTDTKASNAATAAANAQNDVDAMEERVSAAETAIDQNTEAITLRATKSEVSTVSTVANNAKTAAATAQTTADGVKNNLANNYYTSVQTDAKIKVASDSITSTVSSTYATKTDLSNVKIGGRNLFENSANLTSSAIQYYSCPERTVTTGEDSKVPSGKYIAFTMGESDGTFQGGPYLAATFGKQIPKMIEGETYTVSVWAKCSTEKDAGIISAEFLSGQSSIKPTLSTEWQKYVVTGTYNGHTTTSVAITFYYASKWITGDVFYISSPMVEYGNKATDWKPAPEDMATEAELTSVGNRVTQAETRITQNANSITSVASRTTANESAISTLEQTADGLTVRLGTAESDIDTAQATANTAKTNAATAQSTADTAKTNAATAQSTANAAKTAAANAQSTADTAKTNAATAQSTANTANSTANTAKTNAATAQSTANTANTTANTALTNTKLQSDVTNYAQLNDDTAEYWGFTADTTADGHWYTMKVLSRDKFISGWHRCTGSERFKVSFEISTSCKGNSTNGGTDSVYRGTTIGLYGYNDAGTSVGIQYATRITGSADAPVTTVSSIIGLASTARKFRVFVQTESFGNFSGSIKIRKVRVDKIDDEAAKTATNYLNFSNSGLVVGNHTASTLGKNVLIDSDSVDIRNGTTVMASFGADTIELGKHSRASVIDLCNGTGTVRADTYDPVTNSTYGSEGLFLESDDRVVIDSKIVRLNCDNKGDSDSGYNQVYMSNWVTEDSAYLNMEAVDQNTTDGTTNFGRFEARSHDLINVLGMDAAENEPYAMVEARNASYLNRFYMYPTFSRMTQKLLTTGGIISKGNIVIGSDAYGVGGRALGVNKVLWSGGMYMTAGHTATLSEAVSKQPNGIALVFCRYSASTVQNYHFNMHFVPKQQIATHGGCGHTFLITTDGTFGLFATKYLYIHDTKIVGNDVNNANGTGACGITYNNAGFVLRYVIGV